MEKKNISFKVLTTEDGLGQYLYIDLLFTLVRTPDQVPLAPIFLNKETGYFNGRSRYQTEGFVLIQTSAKIALEQITHAIREIMQFVFSRLNYTSVFILLDTNRTEQPVEAAVKAIMNGFDTFCRYHMPSNARKPFKVYIQVKENTEAKALEQALVEWRKT